MRFTKADKKLIARAQKQEVYEEDDWGDTYLVGYRCKVCKRVFTSLDDLEVDHIHPRSRGGVDNPSNLRLLCPRDNRRKGSTVKGEGVAVGGKGNTVKKKSSTVKRKGSMAKSKGRKAKKKGTTGKSKGTTVKRRRR